MRRLTVLKWLCAVVLLLSTTYVFTDLQQILGVSMRHEWLGVVFGLVLGGAGAGWWWSNERIEQISRREDSEFEPGEAA